MVVPNLSLNGQIVENPVAVHPLCINPHSFACQQIIWQTMQSLYMLNANANKPIPQAMVPMIANYQMVANPNMEGWIPQHIEGYSAPIYTNSAVLDLVRMEVGEGKYVEGSLTLTSLSDIEDYGSSSEYIPTREEDTDSTQTQKKGSGYTLKSGATVAPAIIVPKGEWPEGCMNVQNKESKEQDSKIEAQSHCIECDEKKQVILNNLDITTSDQVKRLDSWLSAVTEGDASLGRWASSGSRTRAAGKLCTGKGMLQKVIDNVEKSCGMKFSDLLPKIYCDSCNKGILPDVTLAMMTAESLGNCKALNKGKGTKEASVGLLQVDATQHQCRGNAKGSAANEQCLYNPINNLFYGQSILSDFYNRVNPAIGENMCFKSWKDIPVEKRDAWRRAVSAYNGGPNWVNRAVESVENVKFSQGTNLRGTHEGNTLAGVAKQSKVDWETLRMYYFKEKLHGKNGRDIQFTISNVAHVEAIFGREVEGSHPALIDAWSDYIQDYSNKNQAFLQNQCKQAQLIKVNSFYYVFIQ